MTNGQNVNERMMQLSNAFKAHADVTDAMNELVAIAEGQLTEMKLLRKERDEAIFWRDIARRMVCDLKVADEWGFSARYLAKEFAEVQGWDCFEQEETQ